MTDEIKHQHGPFEFWIRNEDGMRQTYAYIRFIGTDKYFSILTYPYLFKLSGTLKIVTKKSTPAEIKAFRKYNASLTTVYAPYGEEYIIERVKEKINCCMDNLFNNEYAMNDHSHTLS